jgi:hypothetical protein
MGFQGVVQKKSILKILLHKLQEKLLSILNAQLDPLDSSSMPTTGMRSRGVHHAPTFISIGLEQRHKIEWLAKYCGMSIDPKRRRRAVSPDLGRQNWTLGAAVRL